MSTYRSDAEYFVVKGWYDESCGMSGGTFYGACCYPDQPLQPVRVVLEGADAIEASIHAAGNSAPVYTNELIEEEQRPKLQHKSFAGFDITIENPSGSTRSGKSEDGHEWSIEMSYDYGFLKRTSGADGEGIDVYVGPNEEAANAYVVHQNNPSTKQFDEDKVMLGFDSSEEAKEAYLAHYDNPNFFGSMTEIPMETFREAVENKGDKFKWKLPQTGIKMECVCGTGAIADRPMALGGSAGMVEPDVLLTRNEKIKRRKPKMPHRNKIGSRTPTISQTGGRLGGNPQ